MCRTSAEERLQVRSQAVIVPLRNLAQPWNICNTPIGAGSQGVTGSVASVSGIVRTHRSLWQETKPGRVSPGDPCAPDAPPCSNCCDRRTSGAARARIVCVPLAVHQYRESTMVKIETCAALLIITLVSGCATNGGQHDSASATAPAGVVGAPSSAPPPLNAPPAFTKRLLLY